MQSMKISEGKRMGRCSLRPELMLALALLFSGIIIYWSYLFGDRLLIFEDMAGDTKDQYISQYISLVRHIREGNFTFWNFEQGLGMNEFCISLFDPSLMLLFAVGVLFGIKAMMQFLPVLAILRIILAGLAAYGLLSQFSYSTQAKLAAAYAYGMNGYLMIWGQHYQFGMVTVYIPLLLLFAERTLQKKKGRVLFPVMVCVCAVYSVYLTYMCLIGTGLYLLLRSCTLNVEGKERVKRFLASCGQILLGIGMGMVIFAPLAFAVVGISFRTSHGDFEFSRWLRSAFTPYTELYYESLIKRMFSSNLQNRHTIRETVYLGWGNYFEAPVMFFSPIFPFLGVQFLIKYRKAKESLRQRVVVYLGVLLICTALLLPVGGMMFNGFLVPSHRYTFVLFPFFAMAMAWVWDDMKRGGTVNPVLVLLVFCLANTFFREGYKISTLACDRTNAVFLAVLTELTTMLLLGASVIRSASGRKKLLYIGMLLLAAGTLSEGITCYQGRNAMKKEDAPLEGYEAACEENMKQRVSEDMEEAVYAELNYPQEYFRQMNHPDIQAALAYLESEDKEFYRVEKDFYSITQCMDSLIQGYRGVSSYNSVMNGYVSRFFDSFCPEIYQQDHARTAFWAIADNTAAASILGVKYLLSEKENLDTRDYIFIRKFGEIYLYKNARETSMARFYDQTVSEDSFWECVGDKGQAEPLSEVLILENGEERKELPEKSQAMQGSEVILDVPERDDFLTGRALAASDGYLFFAIPFEKGWNIYIDGEKTEALRGNVGFLACAVEEGEHEIVLSYKAPYMREGAVLSLIFWGVYLAIQAAVQKRKKRAAVLR